jgi:hypothetical protein
MVGQSRDTVYRPEDRMTWQNECGFIPLMQANISKSRPGSSVGIATGYGLDGSGIDSRYGRDSPHLSRPALGSTQTSVQWIPGLSPGRKRPGRDADPSPPSSAEV